MAQLKVKQIKTPTTQESWNELEKLVMTADAKPIGNDHVELLVEKNDKFLKVEELLGEEINLGYKTEGSCAFDLIAAIPEPIEIPMGTVIVIPTGIKVVVPTGYALQIMCRSSSIKTGRIIVNAPGLIDQDYRGEIMVGMTRVAYGTEDTVQYKGAPYEQAYPVPVQPGERIAQALLVKIGIADFKYTTVNNDTARGSGGFGSTGKQ